MRKESPYISEEANLDLLAIADSLTPRDTVRVKLALIIENRPSDYKTIKGYLAELDPGIECVQFQSFHELAYWFRLNFIPDHESLAETDGGNSAEELSELQGEPTTETETEPETETEEESETSEPSSEVAGDDDPGPDSEEELAEITPNYSFRKVKDGDEILLMISNHKIFGSKHKLLLQKLGQFFKAKGFLAEEQKVLPALFTVSETDDSFVIQEYLEPYINNFLFRPLDRLVCQAKILWALHGKEAIDKMELYKEAATDLLEMRKDIQTLELSETGFRVLSNQPLKKGAFAKYYGPDFFNNGPRDGIFAIVQNSEPSTNLPNQYEVELNFLGIDSKQIRAIRSKLEELNDGYAGEEPVPKAKSSPVGVVVLCEDKTISHQIKEQLEESFENIDVKTFGNFVDFLLNIDPEYGAQELLDQQSESEEIYEFRYNFDSDVFLGLEPEAPGDSIFGIPASQLNSFKAFLLQQLPPDDRPELLSFWSQGAPDAVHTIKLVIEGSTSLVSLFDRKVEDSTLSFKLRRASLEEVTSFMSGQSRLPKTIGAVLVSDRMAGYRDSAFWLGLKEKMIAKGFHSQDELALFRLAESAIKDQQIAERHSAFDDSLVVIVDHRYMTLRISKMVRGLKFKREKPVELKSDFPSTIQSARLVSDVEVNEVNIILRYNRPIGVGKYRYFSFWDKKTGHMEVFLSKCVENEKDPDNKGAYLNYFLLYGLTDPENAFLRNWMIEQYRLAKGASEKGA